MRILLVNKFHYLRGGSEKYYFELAQLLKNHGHTVAYFSMKNENNITTSDREYFVEEIDMNTASKLKAFDVIYSNSNKKLMKKALEEFKPDIVHINNFQRQLSASILDAIKEKNIPVVMTAHDLNPVCPASVMLCNGEPCDDCLTKGYTQCIKKKCIKDSTLKSILGYLEKKYYDLRHMFKKVDCIISPSEFVKSKFEQGKLSCNEIKVIHNFVNKSSHDESELGNYAFYFGRLSRGKGIFNLLEAIKGIDNAKLVIAGDGEERDAVENYINDNDLSNRVDLIGYQEQDNIRKCIAHSRFVVVPSIWNENCPYSVLEAMEIGKAVIGSDMGGIPELIDEGENGFLYRADDVNELRSKMQILFDDDKIADDFAKRSKELFEQNYTSSVYYEKLMNIYNSLKK